MLWTVVVGILAGIALTFACLAWRAPALIWSGLITGLLALLTVRAGGLSFGFMLCWALFLPVAVLLTVKPLRRMLISRPIFGVFKKVLPQISQTEQEALDAGTVWWDGELFSGRPDWHKLLAYPKPQLSVEEQAFLDNETEELCRMVDDWQVTHELYDLPPEVWQYIKDKGFLGMIIPKQYGGLGFSALAHSAVVVKLASRSVTAAVTVMVPNSLGPAELMLHYGTEQQKSYYLPRLAKGLEIPCFALTGPEAGSDAGSIPDVGIVCRGNYDGQEVLGIRVTWEKRYITLGPVATLLGLAFKLFDPDHLLGDKEEIGITLAMIPTDHPGVNIGRRHFPLNSPFQNGPNSGKDVFIPMDWIIGGVERVGQGWRMLMECLAAGRSISLPAQSIAGAKLAARTTGAYGRVRVQFKTAIGRFEGVEEALARIGANAYMMEATRVMTAGAIDLGEKPSVVSAIAKYHLTERNRQVINDAMDVHGGKGICLGPKNYLGRGYQGLPIAITVEGANILTRSLIIFGQGAIRCHPYVLKEVAATKEPNPVKALKDFDHALFGHLAFTFGNAVRAHLISITSARFVSVPGAAETRRYYQQLTRVSAGFALMADVAMMVLGGSLKLREKLSARLGDMLSLMYLCSATLKRYEDEGRQQADLPLLHWAMQDAFYKMQEAADGFLDNFPNRLFSWKLRFHLFPYGKRFAPPSDKLGHQVAQLLLEPSAARDRLTEGIYLPLDETQAVGCVELAMQAMVKADPVAAKIRAAVKAGKISAKQFNEQAELALKQGIISQSEAAIMAEARRLQRAAIMVDDFDPYFGKESEWQAETQPIKAVASIS